MSYKITFLLLLVFMTFPAKANKLFEMYSKNCFLFYLIEVEFKEGNTKRIAHCVTERNNGCEIYNINTRTGQLEFWFGRQPYGFDGKCTKKGLLNDMYAKKMLKSNMANPIQTVKTLLDMKGKKRIKDVVFTLGTDKFGIWPTVEQNMYPKKKAKKSVKKTKSSQLSYKSIQIGQSRKAISSSKLCSFKKDYPADKNLSCKMKDDVLGDIILSTHFSNDKVTEIWIYLGMEFSEEKEKAANKYLKQYKLLSKHNKLESAKAKGGHSTYYGDFYEGGNVQLRYLQVPSMKMERLVIVLLNDEARDKEANTRGYIDKLK